MTWKTVEVIDHSLEGASPDFVALFVSPSTSILFLSDLPKNLRLDDLIFWEQVIVWSHREKLCCSLAVFYKDSINWHSIYLHI